MSARFFTPDQEREVVALRQTGISVNALAQQFGCSMPTVRDALRKHGLIGRLRTVAFTPEQVTEMATMWHAGMSQRQIGETFGVTQFHIWRTLAAAGIPRPATKPNVATGAQHGSWKGGRIRHIDGYEAVMVARDDPYRPMASNYGYVLEHRLVMARALGRLLTSHESVHHINGDKADNRLENLQLRQGKHGTGEALRCRDCGSFDIESVPLQPIAQHQLALLVN